ncbi:MULTISPECIES: fatty acyl-AMP ligase [unclassified Serratia (in: enterobacteria)]|uniref:fatty acyl-AMP ligase n=1 Tax=unclassified Serratia (in: enterobacteria) TaxID=2647522 RepID=UPI003075F1E6
MKTNSIAHMLTYHVGRVGNKCAYKYYSPRSTNAVSLSYRELYDSALSIGNIISFNNFRGKYALLMYPPGLDFIEAFFGCMFGNMLAIPMYIPPSNEPDSRLSSIISNVDIEVVFTVSSTLEQVTQQVKKLFNNKRYTIICTDKLESINTAHMSINIDLDIPPLIQFTSGSTSAPKGVIVGHDNLIANLRMIEHGFCKHTQLSGGETSVSWLPFFHDMGLIWGILYPIYTGGSSILMSPNDFLHHPYKWLQLISMYQASISGAPNFAYDYCVTRIREEKIEGLDLSSWKVAFNGSEMIRPTTIQRFIERFQNYKFDKKSFFFCYGMAETTLYVSGETGVIGDVDSSVSVGQIDEQAELVIVDENYQPLPDCHRGEIWVRGPHVARGYVDNPEATKDIFGAKIINDTSGKEYLRTGDLGYLTQGKLHVTGRMKNMIIVNGKNYYGEEIEYFVVRKKDYFVETGACVTRINEGRDDSEIVFIQEIKKQRLNEVSNELIELEELAIELSRKILHEFKLSVNRFIFLGTTRLPRTSSGKIDRARVHEVVNDKSHEYLLNVHTI